MTINEAINRVDALCINAFPPGTKAEWINNMEMGLQRTLFKTVPLVSYVFPEDGDAELMVDDAYSELYIKWLMTMIRYHSEDYAEYNNAAQDYNALLQEYRAWYQRTQPKQSSAYVNLY